MFCLTLGSGQWSWPSKTMISETMRPKQTFSPPILFSPGLLVTNVKKLTKIVIYIYTTHPNLLPKNPGLLQRQCRDIPIKFTNSYLLFLLLLSFILLIHKKHKHLYTHIHTHVIEHLLLLFEVLSVLSVKKKLKVHFIFIYSLTLFHSLWSPSF